MAFLPTNASQVQQFAVALYGIQVGTATMAAVQADITSIGGLNKALNSYFTASFGSSTTAAVGASVAANLGLTGTAATDAAAYIAAVLNGTAASARGEAIQGVLNLFSTMTANATFGAAAIAWNNKVTAAVAYTGAADVALVAGVTTGTVFSLDTGVNTFTGTAGNDTFNATTADSLTTFDNIEGGAGTDLLNVNVTGTALPAAITINNVEKVSINSTGPGYTIDTTTGTTGFAGLTDLSVADATAGNVVVTAAATTNITASQADQAANAITVNGGNAVNIAAAGATTGVISVGATTAPKGAVTVSETVVIAPGAAAGAITVKGGTTVSITETATATSATAGTTATQSAITATGTADTTSVAVKQTAAKDAVKEVFAYTIATGAGANTDKLAFDGVTYTAASVLTATATATAFVAAYNVDVAANWVAADSGAGKITFTAKVAGSLVDIVTAGFVVTGALAKIAGSAAAPTTQGTAAIVNGAVTITDVNSASATAAGKITTVDLNGFDAATANSNAINTVNLAGTGASYTQTKGALTTAISTTDALNLKGVTTTGTVDLGAVTKTINLASTTAANKLAALSASSATALNLSGDQALTLTATTLATAAVITNTATGAVTITGALGTSQKYVGSAAADTITLGASTVANTLGDGNDKVVISNATVAMGTGGSLDGGAGGVDTISFATYADAVSASGAATFKAGVTGFEAVELAGANAAAAAAVNLANLGTGINAVTFSATNTETTTISNLPSGGTVTFKAAGTAGKAATIALTDATGTADVLNVVLSKATALATVEVTAAGVETVNITSTETATTLLGTVTHAATLLAVDAKTLNISGNAGATLVLTNDTALTSIDASGVTSGLVSFTTAALTTAAAIKGGAGANTIVASAATKAVTYTGQDKVDTITIDTALNNVVNTAGGADVIVTGPGADTINAGAGDDTITSGTGLDIISGGAGNDTFNIVAPTNGNTYASITDINKGDIISVADQGTETFATTKISLADTALFADYLSAATAAINAAANGNWTWFQFSGSTYLVQDNSDTAAFVNGMDIIVKLSGLVDLSTATGGTTNAITIA